MSKIGTTGTGPEQLDNRLLTRQEVLRALADGATIQVQRVGALDWNYFTQKDQWLKLCPQNYDEYAWRLKPTLRRVPLEAKDIPAVCWFRNIYEKEYPVMVVGLTPRGVMYVNSYTNKIIHTRFEDCVNTTEYTSTPQDESSWKGCWKEVSE